MNQTFAKRPLNGICAALTALVGTVGGLGMLSGARAAADEGMWLVDQPPTAQLQARHGFTPSAEWLLRMQRSAVRFSSGGSGSIVSSRGLVMTNHHVGRDQVQQLSTAEKDYIANGFLARTSEQELKCGDLELDVLWSTRDVTAEVNADGASTDAATRRKNIAAIEAAGQKAAADATPLAEGSGVRWKAQVVTLYQGGAYHLYIYKTFSDIRLVFAPEQGIAFFGGDTDNFEFPRFNLDCTFFRIYVDNKPLEATNHLAWSAAGAAENESVFVFGHPGRTRRLYTVDHLKFLRDVQLPRQLAELWRSEVKWKVFADASAENRRISQEDIFGLQNGRKVFTGLLQGLQDERLMRRKIRAEGGDRAVWLEAARAAQDQSSSMRPSDPWQTIAETARMQANVFERHRLFTRGLTGSKLLQTAHRIVQLADELPKPSGERLSEYRDTGLTSLYASLYAPSPIDAGMEVEALTQYLSLLAERLGGDEPIVRAALGGVSPAARAAQLVKGCTLADVSVRKQLVEGGRDAVDAAIAGDASPSAASNGPSAAPNAGILALARTLDAESRRQRAVMEESIEPAQREAYAQIAKLQFESMTPGNPIYPDATFTLRMSFGRVQGLPSVTGPASKPFTTFAGLYERAAQRAGEEAFTLPPSWQKAKATLNLETPFNLTCDADIIGGNSGSPLVNRAGEVVGLIFDGNVHSLIGDVAYDSTNARAIAVDSRGMLESFAKVYNATELVQELQNTK